MSVDVAPGVGEAHDLGPHGAPIYVLPVGPA